ncbi:sulfotransferase family 2 domain-containing protein [Thiohalorhabdus sp.]|uniref:sulfotransferase family 2 domain-containing protein n=1 Tax=Thiohalorhabdus sp. TaxID=3094134 RepID=UPI002FC2B2BC
MRWLAGITESINPRLWRSPVQGTFDLGSAGNPSTLWGWQEGRYQVRLRLEGDEENVHAHFLPDPIEANPQKRKRGPDIKTQPPPPKTVNNSRGHFTWTSPAPERDHRWKCLPPISGSRLSMVTISSHLPASSFLWLHIKKSGGQSIRKALGESYVETHRKNPSPFLALPRQEWNDNLNNFRIPLGEYDYRRMLFAKEFLYPDDFSERFKFTVVRNPYARAVSCWKYLTRRGVIQQVWPRFRLRHRFEDFLAMLPEAWASRKNRQLATHTAPVWPDITDGEGRLLVDFIGHLETIEEDFGIIAWRLGLPSRPSFPRENAYTGQPPPERAYTRKTLRMVEQLYESDIEMLDYNFPRLVGSTPLRATT